jgi:hypothetical protein
MAAISDAARPAEIHGPEDPELAPLWSLAVAKFTAREDREPTTRDDWNVVTKEYSRLLQKPHGSIAQIIAERCEEVPGGD